MWLLSNPRRAKLGLLTLAIFSASVTWAKDGPPRWFPGKINIAQRTRWDGSRVTLTYTGKQFWEVMVPADRKKLSRMRPKEGLIYLRKNHDALLTRGLDAL